MTHSEVNLLHYWSSSRCEDSYLYKPFSTEHQLSLKYWTNAWQWSSLNKHIAHRKGFYCMVAGEDKNLSTQGKYLIIFIRILKYIIISNYTYRRNQVFQYRSTT